jgi:hypothetical protein
MTICIDGFAWKIETFPPSVAFDTSVRIELSVAVEDALPVRVVEGGGDPAH